MKNGGKSGKERGKVAEERMNERMKNNGQIKMEEGG